MNRPLTEADWIQYEIADKLVQIETDPDGRPFKSKYESRDLLSLLRMKLLSHLEEVKTESDDVLILESALATISYEIAQNFYTTEERPSAENFAKEILERIERYSTSSNQTDDSKKAFTSAAIALRNTLGCIYCERSEPDAAIRTLGEADQLYLEYVKGSRDDIPPPWELKRPLRWVCGVLENINDQFSLNEDPRATFEQLHTYTLYYLAQAHKLNGEFGLSAKYCQETLARQLRAGSYDPIEWSLNAATLSVYYVAQGTAHTFQGALHCLAAASAVLDSSKDAKPSEKQSRASADIDRCWVKYGIGLMENSRQNLFGEDGTDRKEAGKVEDSGPNAVTPVDDFSAYLPNITNFEREFTSDFVTDFASAREVFMQVQRRIAAAQSFYTMIDHATDYTELIQDSSLAYKTLIFFESDIDRKCKMHKRRIDLLAAVYKELNPTHYLAIRRQLAFELGEIYNDMLDLKIEIANGSDGAPNAHQIAKINMLAESGMKYFQEFAHSFEKPEEAGAKEVGDKQKYDTADVRPILLAHFYCARLFSKLLTGNMKEKLVNCDASLREYRWVVDYIDRVDPGSLECAKSEYEIAKDMVSLLPMKMDRMRNT